MQDNISVPRALLTLQGGGRLNFFLTPLCTATILVGRAGRVEGTDIATKRLLSPKRDAHLVVTQNNLSPSFHLQ